MIPKQLNFITGNANKLREVKAILGNAVQLESQSLDLLEIQGTIEEVSVHKARTAAELVSPRSKYIGHKATFFGGCLTFNVR